MRSDGSVRIVTSLGPLHGKQPTHISLVLRTVSGTAVWRARTGPLYPLSPSVLLTWWGYFQSPNETSS